MAMPSRLSMLERAGRHKQTALDPLARADAAREDAYAGIARRGFLDQEARGRQEARGANDVLRGSGFGQFFDSLADVEAGAAFDGKDFSVRMDQPRGGVSRLNMLEQGGRGSGGGVRTPPPSGITVQGPRVDPDRYTPPYMPETWKRDGVSPLAGTVRRPGMEIARTPGDPNVALMLDTIRTGRVESERRPVLDAAETEAAQAFVPSAVKMREEQTRVKELIERIKAQAGIQEAEIGADASRYGAEQRAAATRDAARMRSTRPGPDRLDRANTLNSLYNSGVFKPGRVPDDEALRNLYNWLLESGAMGTAPGTGGAGEAGGDDLDAQIDALLDSNPDLTDEEIMAILSRGGGF